MNDRPLTIRLESGSAVISNDDGESHRIAGAAVEEIRRLAAAGHDLEPAGALTAAALGTLNEAARVRPRVTAQGETAESPAGNDTIELGDHLLEASRPFAEILGERRSERHFKSPAQLAELATILVRSGRTTGWRETVPGQLEDTRALPSAGARTPIELEVVTSGVHGVPRGHWRFDALRCRLVKCEDDSVGKVEGLLDEREIVVEGGWSTIFALADFGRTLDVTLGVRRWSGATLELSWRGCTCAQPTLERLHASLGHARCCGRSIKTESSTSVL